MATEILKRPFRFNFAQIGYFTDQDGTRLSTTDNNFVLGEGVSYRDIPKSSAVPMENVNPSLPPYPIRASVQMGYGGRYGMTFNEPWDGDPDALTKHGNAYAKLQIIEASNGHKYWTGQTRKFDVWKTHTVTSGHVVTVTKSTIEYTFSETDFQTTTDDDGIFTSNPSGPSTYVKNRGILLGQWEQVNTVEHYSVSATSWHVAGYDDDETSNYYDLTPETAMEPLGFFQPPGG